MNSGTIKFYINPYGSAKSAVEMLMEQDPPYRDWLRSALRRPSGGRKHLAQLMVASAFDLDPSFVQWFRKTSLPDARLLVMNPLDVRHSTDQLCTKLMAIPIRSAERLYVADCRASDLDHLSIFLGTLFKRLAASYGGEGNSDRILNAIIFNDTLHVISADFKRLEVPITKIPSLVGKEGTRLLNFEIDEDGAFIYWPELDVHLGWEQLEQIVNPAAAFKAQQRHHEFNVQYGKAVRTLREKAGIKLGQVPELSEKQLRRIERGECRLTSNAIDALAKAHGVSPNEYLNSLADGLSHAGA